LHPSCRQEASEALLKLEEWSPKFATMSPLGTLNPISSVGPAGQTLMTDLNLLEMLGKASSGSASEVFRSYLRVAVLGFLHVPVGLFTANWAGDLVRLTAA